MPNFFVNLQAMNRNVTRCVDRHSDFIAADVYDHDFDLRWPVADDDDFAGFSRKC